MTRTSVRWSPHDDAKLLRLRDGERWGFPEIAAAMPGRTAPACEQRYYGKLKGVRDKRPRPSGPKPTVPPVSWRKRGAAVAIVAPAAAVEVVAPPAPVAIAPRIRTPLLDGLRERAELHLRIAERGLTAAFFGDPPPGRSALDERTRAAGAVTQRPPANGGSDAG
jgi:hypothetical protein